MIYSYNLRSCMFGFIKLIAKNDTKCVSEVPRGLIFGQNDHLNVFVIVNSTNTGYTVQLHSFAVFCLSTY